MRRASQTGFSLLELLVASSIFFSFMVGMTVLYSKSNRSFARGQNRIQVQQSARVAAHALVREVRGAGFDPSSALASFARPAAVRSAEADRLAVVVDADGDGVTDRVTFSLTDGSLVRERAAWDGTAFVVVDTGELAEGIESLVFRYYDDSATNVELVTPVSSSEMPRIRRITVDLVAARAAAVSEERFPLSLDVRLRNAAAAAGAGP